MITTVEGNESIIVDVTSVTNGTENGVQQVTATIVDDDTANVNLTLAPTSLARKRRHRDGHRDVVEPSTQDVTINWRSRYGEWRGLFFQRRFDRDHRWQILMVRSY